MTHPVIRPHCVAVITGAAAGIGFAIACRLAGAGMKIVLFDKDQQALHTASSMLMERTAQDNILTVTGDVTSTASLQALFDHACEFGEVSVVINNAAIIQGAGPWQTSTQWRTVMETNFWSVLHIQQLFVPHLLAQNTPAAIVNLGSKEGITTPPGNAAYSVSKAAIKVLTEQLQHELRQHPAQRVSAHLLIPGYTFTPMNFPGMTSTTVKPPAPWTAAQVAECLVEGMNKGDFYIFCEDNEVSWQLDQRRIQWSADDMILNRPALSRWHPDYQAAFKTFIS